MLTLELQLLAEGQQNELVVMGEKGRAQLARDRSSYIKETIADTQKVRITFSQVWPASHSAACCCSGSYLCKEAGHSTGHGSHQIMMHSHAHALRNMLPLRRRCQPLPRS